MKVADFETSACIGMSRETRQILKLFCTINDVHVSKLTNQLYRQYFFNNLASLELQFPDKQNDWDDIRSLLHSNKI